MRIGRIGPGISLPPGAALRETLSNAKGQHMRKRLLGCVPFILTLQAPSGSPAIARAIAPPKPLRAVAVECPAPGEPALPSPVIAKVKVSKTGSVTSVKLEKSTGSKRNDDRIMEAVRQIPFEPARTQAGPRAGQITMAIAANCQ